MEPTYSYLDQLSGSNREFKIRIIKIILNELPKDFDLYLYALELRNYHWAAEIVHRLKQKISFLQMTNSATLADEHEFQLRQGQLIYTKQFNEIIEKTLKFLENTQE